MLSKLSERHEPDRLTQYAHRATGPRLKVEPCGQPEPNLPKEKSRLLHQYEHSTSPAQPDSKRAVTVRRAEPRLSKMCSLCRAQVPKRKAAPGRPPQIQIEPRSSRQSSHSRHKSMAIIAQ